MSTLSVTNPTLLDLRAAMDPNGNIAQLIEILNETNEVLDDMTYLESNEITGHVTSVRTGLPAPTWRKLYGGVQPTKSTVIKVRESMGALEAYAEVDKELADLNNNSAAFRMSEDRAHIEGMNQEVASSLFYATEATAPEEFTGLSPRFNDTSAANGENIIDGTAAGDDANADKSSIWLVGWSPRTVHGLYPKGTSGGFHMEDKGQVTIENVDGANGRMEAYRTHYKWRVGLALRDWRYVVRIANIQSGNLTADLSAGADLINLMTQATEQIWSVQGVRPVFYMNRTLRKFLRLQQVAKVKAGGGLTFDNLAGRRNVPMFDGIPVRRVDALLNTEAKVA